MASSDYVEAVRPSSRESGQDGSSASRKSPQSPANYEKWGLPLVEVYKLALSFYKDKEGKAVQLSYEDKLNLVAFAQQASHGPLATAVSKLPPVGALDVVGRDRRMAWQRLGDLAEDNARIGFVELLHRKCPLFQAFVEAHRCKREEQNRLLEELARQKLEEQQRNYQLEEENRRRQEEADRQEAAKRQIKQALNEQTYDQFRLYAEHQFPGEPERQSALVRQLQEQHYIQYMQQLQNGAMEERSVATVAGQGDVDSDNEVLEDDCPEDTVCAASMWTRSDIQAFKQLVSKASGDGVVRVGHGETVTVRVPTHREGSRLFWEFATDHYDIGFGVYFEWGAPLTEQVSVHVSESEDEEDGEDLDVDDEDEEALVQGALEPAPGRPLLTEIVPVFRRDCQTEVYAGSHVYPGPGVYLLKFDNSYSLWRSKTLYYRVYYTQ